MYVRDDSCNEDDMKEKIRSLCKYSWFVALLINLSFLIMVFIFLDMKYETSDDFVVDSILSGAYGLDYDPHLLFSNILLGFGLKILYVALPTVSWYFVMHIALCFISLTVITYIIIENCRGNFGVFVAIIFVSFFSDDLYVLVQFTKTAAVCIMAGGILFLYAFWRQKGKIRIVYSIIGMLLCIIGTMIRFWCMYFALLFLMVIFISEWWNFAKRNNKKSIVARGMVGISLCSVLVVLAIFINHGNESIWKSNYAYRDFLSLNLVRASVTDIDGFNEDEVIECFEQLDGTTLQDYYTIKSWNLVDQSVYTPERIGQFAEIMHANAAKENHSISSIISILKARHYEKYTVVWGICILILVNVIVHRKKAWIVILDCAVAGVLLCYLAFSGRIVYRVEYGVFLCLAISLIWHLVMEENEKFQESRVWLIAAIVLLCAKIPLYIPDTNYKTMNEDEYNSYIYDTFNKSDDYNISRYRVCVNKRPAYAELIGLMENDAEHYYLCDLSSTIQTLYYHYKPWIRMPIGYYKDTYSYLGGVTTYFPGCYYVWEENGLNPYNPYETIRNDDILIVDNNYQLTKINYYKQYYDVNAELELVQECDGYSIWRIR